MSKFFSKPKPPKIVMPKLPEYTPPPEPEKPPEMPDPDDAQIAINAEKKYAARSSGGRAGTVYGEDTLG